MKTLKCVDFVAMDFVIHSNLNENGIDRVY